MTNSVWLAWSGDYEDRGVWAVGRTREAAIRAVKAIFVEPCIVTWYEKDGELIGDFEDVPGHAIKHTMDVSFEEYEVAE